MDSISRAPRNREAPGNSTPKFRGGRTALALLAALTVLALTYATPERAAHASPDLIHVNASSSIFPGEWLKPPISAYATPLDHRESARARQAVSSGLAKYPRRLLRENLEAVYLVGRLGYSGITAGGTNSLSRVYVADRGRANGYTQDHLERILHAEFSSILLRNHPKALDARAWSAQNPRGFAYGQQGHAIEAIKSHDVSDALTSHGLNEGFLSDYARTDAENDFNAFAEHLWTGDSRLWTEAAHHPRIHAKLELAIAFYRTLDPSLDARFFRTLIRQNDQK